MRKPDSAASLLADATSRLRKLGIETPYLDATLLLSTALSTSREDLFARLPDSVDAGAIERFHAMIARRASGEPVSYIRGFKEFYGREFRVDPRVLVPRPDTEVLVEVALQILDDLVGGDADGRAPRDPAFQANAPRAEPIRVHDACTGSGAVAISIKAERPTVEVSVSDVSDAALAVCYENCILQLGSPLPSRRSDLLSEVAGRFHLIVSNPPYLTSAETDAMKATGWPEPALALDGGADGLDLIRSLAAQAVEHLVGNGYLCIEAADPQGPTVCDILSSNGFVDVSNRYDLAGRRRVTVGRKP